MNELKEAVGEQFQGYLRSWVGHLRDLVGFLKDNSDWLVKFGEPAIFVAGAIVTYGIITKIAGIATAVEGLSLALIANPIALLLTGVVAGGAIIWKTWQDTKAGLDQQYEDMRRKGLQKDLFSGKLKPDDVKKMGYTDDQVREIATGKKLLPGESWGDFGGPKLNIKIGGKPELSDAEINRIAAERKKQGEAAKPLPNTVFRGSPDRALTTSRSPLALNRRLVVIRREGQIHCVRPGRFRRIRRAVLQSRVRVRRQWQGCEEAR